MSALDRLPALATTGVGSLPFGDPVEAARHALRAYELPFCPQLPRLDGDMVREWLGSDPGRCGWSADRDRRRPAAWEAFAFELAARPPEHRLVKLQVTGPVTLAAALERAGGRPGCGADVLSLAPEVAVWLAANAAEQVRRLHELGLDVLLLVDEPGLGETGLGPAEVAVWDPLRAVADAWGLHVCGVVPWHVVDSAAPHVISFDLGRYGVDLEARAALTALVLRGGRVAWGAFDPLSPGDAELNSARVLEAVAACGLPAELVARRSIVTPACGSGRLSLQSERLIAATLAATAAGARQRFQPGSNALRASTVALPPP